MQASFILTLHIQNSNELEIMSASDDSDIFIPSVFVGQTAGQIILYDYMYLNGESWLINRYEISVSHGSFSFFRFRARVKRRFSI